MDEDNSEDSYFDPLFLVHGRTGCNLISIFLEALGFKDMQAVLKASRSAVEKGCFSEGGSDIPGFKEIPFPGHGAGFIKQWCVIQGFIQSKLSEIKDEGYETAKVTKTEHVLDEQMKKFSVSFKNTCRHLKVYLGKFSEGLMKKSEGLNEEI